MADAQTRQIDLYLQEVLSAFSKRDGEQLKHAFRVDFRLLPANIAAAYGILQKDLRNGYPRSRDAALDRLVKQVLSHGLKDILPENLAELVITNTVLYLKYVRDFGEHVDDVVLVSQITTHFITLLGDPSNGILFLPAVLSLSRALASTAVQLDKSNAIVKTTGKATFVEETANVLRDAFTKCLAGGPASTRNVRPASSDKRSGIYLTANSCLKLLFHCGKLRNAQQLFLFVDAQSPPLAFYPAAQRVTFLYHLGRYHFANNHFHRAQLALASAYAQCHRAALSHRRGILTYLVPTNIILGRLPSAALLSRPEATTLAPHFLPLAHIIRRGDLGAFHAYLSLSDNPATANWFLAKRLLFQLQNRCEVLVWRSLIRKTFILVGFKGEEKKVPFVRLQSIVAAAQWAIRKAGRPPPAVDGGFSFGQPPTASLANSHPSMERPAFVDPEFADLASAITETGFDTDTGEYNNTPGAGRPEDDDTEPSPTLHEVEAITLSLIQQGLLKGFVTHQNPRFAIPGAKAGGGALKVGFPEPWGVINARDDSDDVPGWVQDIKTLPSGAGSGTSSPGGMGGRVINLSGARPVGAAGGS